jgi:quercetin dioxygenase-like cupin family protein
MTNTQPIEVQMKGISNMKLLTATALTLFALVSASAHTSEMTTLPGMGDALIVSNEDSPTITITRNGSQPSRKGPSQFFTGSARIDMLFQANEPSRTTAASVTFEPGARTAWHTHPLGQVLIVMSGTGRIQRWGGPIEEIRAGDVVWIPAGQKHWHGASPTTGMTHIAIQEKIGGKNVDWLEKVSDDQYAKRSEELSIVLRNEFDKANAAERLSN